MADSWNNASIDGWGGYVVKEMFKILKNKLKSWNNEAFGNIDKNIQDLKQRIAEIDRRSEMNLASSQEMIERKNRLANYGSC